ncbi:MAG: ribosome maturation factor RimM [Bdellovibrionaceae bacterium]|nr:ribosome maturation factor RimM [Pseudobdellovibrionaceae bacterium]
MSNENSPKLVQVGKVMDAHGIRGDLYCLVFSGDVSWTDDLEVLYLKAAFTSKVESHEVKRLKEFKKGFIVTLKDVVDRNQAEMLKGAELWAPADLFVSEDGDSIYLKEILHFNLADEAFGAIGPITGFSTNTAQDLLMVSYQNEIIEIPFVKEFVVKIDFEAQTILTKLPEGLLEINNQDEGKPDDAD